MVSYFLQEHPSMWVLFLVFYTKSDMPRYTKVAFIDASSYASIQSDLQAWIQAAGDGHERDTWEDAVKTLASVPLDELWLLVIDNADNPTLDLVPFIPKVPDLTVIVTSRNRDIGNLSTTYHLELGEMEEDEALATLLQAARRKVPLSTEEMESARTLVKSLGCLALALVQAGAYCHQLSSYHHGELKPFSFMRYLSLFYSHRAELMKESQPSPLDSYKRGVYTTLDLSYQALSQVHREFLHFISFFYHADIPLEVLATAARKDFADRRTFVPRSDSHKEVVSDLNQLLCADGNWSELQVQSTIRTLQAFSLLSVTSTDDSIFLQLHPLVQAWSRDMVSSASRHYRAMSIQSLTACSGDDIFRLFRYMLPHILDSLGQVETQALHVNDLIAVGVILKDQGYYQKAAGVVKAALEKMTSADQQVTVGAIDATLWLAQIYYDDGKWNEAEKLGVQVLEQRRKLLGADHIDTIQAAGELALVYSKQGRHSEAEKLDLEALDQRRKILGLEHPDTIKAMANLAATYSHQGRHSEAEKLKLEVLDKRTKILGPEHRDTIIAAANLALTYWKQGRHSEAEKLELEVLDQRRRILGLGHPSTLLAAAPGCHVWRAKSMERRFRSSCTCSRAQREGIGEAAPRNTSSDQESRICIRETG
jgi:tetratricopeptide (TPR) repeat protein